MPICHAQLSREGGESGIEEVAKLLEGYFNNDQQLLTEPTYRPVEITHCVIPIQNSPYNQSLFLYAEQRLKGEASPYRQRVYRLELNGGDVHSVIYALPNNILESIFAPQSETNKRSMDAQNSSNRSVCQRSQNWMQGFQFSSLIETGCVLVLKRTFRSWEGATPKEGCIGVENPEFRTHSSVKLSDEGLVTWDRGYDESGEKKWGADKPYKFKKLYSFIR